MGIKSNDLDRRPLALTQFSFEAEVPFAVFGTPLVFRFVCDILRPSRKSGDPPVPRGWIGAKSNDGRPGRKRFTESSVLNLLPVTPDGMVSRGARGCVGIISNELDRTLVMRRLLLLLLFLVLEGALSRTPLLLLLVSRPLKPIGRNRSIVREEL